MKHKLSFIILSALAAVIITAFCAFSASAETGNVLKYSVSDGEAKITGLTNENYSGSLNIPSTLGGYPVTGIGRNAFYYCNGLTSITIPSSVTSIGDGAFFFCTRLVSITIPTSVTSIGKEAFYYCNGLTSITIPDSVTSIGGGAFVGCSGLTSVTIGNSVTSIGDYAFYYCTRLTSITIPSSVTSIGDYAFYYCTGLTNIIIPDSVTSLGDEAFRGCTGFVSITIPNSVKEIGDDAFKGCDSLTVYCEEGSFAEQYCKEKNIEYSNEIAKTDETVTVSNKIIFFSISVFAALAVIVVVCCVLISVKKKRTKSEKISSERKTDESIQAPAKTEPEKVKKADKKAKHTFKPFADEEAFDKTVALRSDPETNETPSEKPPELTGGSEKKENNEEMAAALVRELEKKIIAYNAALAQLNVTGDTEEASYPNEKTVYAPSTDDGEPALDPAYNHPENIPGGTVRVNAAVGEKEISNCPYCGRLLPPDSEFCQYCGLRLKY